MADISLETAFELLADERADDALGVVRLLLAEDPPETPGLLAFGALILLSLGRRDEARTWVGDARMMAPGHPFIELARGEVALACGEVREALDAATLAEQAAPGYREALLLEARARGRLGQWDEAERIARGLSEADPADEDAATLAAIAGAAHRTGDRLAADEWAELAGRFPANAVLRAGDGWATLQRGQAREARAQFEQALALDPRLEWAREGMLLALKARNPLYAVLLRWFMWVGRLPPRTQNMLGIGGVLGYNALRSLSRANPGIAPFVTPVLVAYAVLVFSSWLADPLLNLLLSFDAETRRFLDDDQRRSGRLVGGVIGCAVVLGVVSAVTSSTGLFLASLGLAMCALAFAASFRVRPGRRRRHLTVTAWLCVALSLAAGVTGEVGAVLFLVAVLLAAACTWMSRFAPEHERLD